MNERPSSNSEPEAPATYDPLDVALSLGMINEGCPNPGSEIVEGALVTAKRAVPKTGALQKESDPTSISA